MRESTAAYRAEQDRFGEFVSDCLVFEIGATITRKALRIAYEEWAKEVGAHRLLTAKDVVIRLRDHGCDERMVKGSRQWTGVRLRHAADDDLGSRGAAGSTNSGKSSCDLFHEEGSGKAAPSCSLVLPGLVDEADERVAIQAERAGQ